MLSVTTFEAPVIPPRVIGCVSIYTMLPLPESMPVGICALRVVPSGRGVLSGTLEVPVKGVSNCALVQIFPYYSDVCVTPLFWESCEVTKLERALTVEVKMLNRVMLLDVAATPTFCGWRACAFCVTDITVSMNSAIEVTSCTDYERTLSF